MRELRALDDDDEDDDDARRKKTTTLACVCVMPTPDRGQTTFVCIILRSYIIIIIYYNIKYINEK